jgi:hypothetical protein
LNQQRKEIIDLLETYLESKATMKEIYDIIVDRLKVPRPTVRREARSLRLKYMERIRILGQNKPKGTKKEKVWYD